MPLELTAGPDGNLYFTTYLVEPKNYIGQVTPEGHLRQFAIPTAGAASFGITAGPDEQHPVHGELHSSVLGG